MSWLWPQANHKTQGQLRLAHDSGFDGVLNAIIEGWTRDITDTRDKAHDTSAVLDEVTFTGRCVVRCTAAHTRSANSGSQAIIARLSSSFGGLVVVLAWSHVGLVEDPI